MNGHIGDIYPGFHQGNDVNAFVGSFVNKDLILSPNKVPNVDVLNATIGTRFGNPYKRLKRFFAAPYGDERNERPLEAQEVHPLNSIQLVFICQVLLRTISSITTQYFVSAWMRLLDLLVLEKWRPSGSWLKRLTVYSRTVVSHRSMQTSYDAVGGNVVGDQLWEVLNIIMWRKWWRRRRCRRLYWSCQLTGK